MKWKKQKSDTFEDRRGMSGGGKAIVGGGLNWNCDFITECIWW